MPSRPSPFPAPAPRTAWGSESGVRVGPMGGADMITAASCPPDPQILSGLISADEGAAPGSML